MQPSPVFSAVVPSKVQALLAEHENLLLASRQPRPKAALDSDDRLIYHMIPLVCVGAGGLCLGGVIGACFIPVSDSAPLIGIVSGLILGILFGYGYWHVWPVLSSTDKGRLRAKRLAWRYHGGYSVGADYDDVTGPLLAQAQQAVRAVLQTRVHQAGLLDQVANELILRETVDDLARDLYEQTTLRIDHQAVSREYRTPELEAVLTVQRAALAQAAATTSRRVAALSAYATKVAVAESVYTAQLLLHDDRYETLASRVRDTTGLAQLSNFATETEQALRAALQAGRTLT